MQIKTDKKNTLPKTAKLLNQNSISNVFNTCSANKGFRFTSPFFTILAIANNREASRAVVIMQKKHFKKAVTRNRLKRQFKEYYRHKRQELYCADIVILGRAVLQKPSTDFKDVYHSLDIALAKMDKYLRSKMVANNE